MTALSRCCFMVLVWWSFNCHHDAAEVLTQEQWPDIRGPQYTYQTISQQQPPLHFSATRGENIVWRLALANPGHSGVTVADDKLFFTCFRPLLPSDKNTQGTWASDIIGYCVDAHTGALLWTHPLPGTRATQVNGIFTDATTPTPLSDGNHVWFINAGGFIACLTHDGTLMWEKAFAVRSKHAAKQFQPFLHDGYLYYAMMREPDDPLRKPQTAQDDDKNSSSGWPWMYVRRFDAYSGTERGIAEQGISVHCKGVLGIVHEQTVLLTQRGGPHAPPEQPYGISLLSLSAFPTIIWDRPNVPFQCIDTCDQEHLFAFDKNSLFVLDLASGITRKEIPLRATACRFRAFDSATNAYVERQQLPATKQLITERTAIPYGHYLYFMSAVQGVLGRVHSESGACEYVQMPLQITYDHNRKKIMHYDTFSYATTTGSGFEITGDQRMHGSGFGHVSAATPIIVNDRLYFTTMLGTVYVIDVTAKTFDENAVLAVNDLGRAGECWTLSPFSYANGRLYQHTMREILCIGQMNK